MASRPRLAHASERARASAAARFVTRFVSISGYDRALALATQEPN
jgi:hypothetical protein